MLELIKQLEDPACFNKCDKYFINLDVLQLDHSSFMFVAALKLLMFYLHVLSFLVTFQILQLQRNFWGKVKLEHVHYPT